AFVRVAYIAKTKYLEGSVVAQSADGLPFLLAEGLRVHFVPPTLRGPRTAVVHRVRQVGEDAYEVSFDGVSGIEDADKVVGCYCLAAKADVADFASLEAPPTLIGFSVVDSEHGLLGQVNDVLESPAQALLVVEGERGQVMIPVVDEFLDGLDEDSRTVYVRIPESLLTLNSG
ncbi:MAG: 16S rRNA processing protein RimM, partial [Eggerthellaceae bacterium]|nr:16S rRNA processing protein RimM [Eggerthellaceae bacterium]